MKIAEAFRDLKNLSGMDKLLCQTRHWMEKMLSLALIAYAVILILAEPLLVKETGNRIRKSFSGLKVYLQAQA